MGSALTQLKDFTPQAIKDTLWAFATLGFTPNNNFLQGSVDQCLALIAQFNPQNIANAIWAFAKFSYHPGRYAELSSSSFLVHPRFAGSHQQSLCILAYNLCCAAV